MLTFGILYVTMLYLLSVKKVLNLVQIMTGETNIYDFRSAITGSGSRSHIGSTM